MWNEDAVQARFHGWIDAGLRTVSCHPRTFRIEPALFPVTQVCGSVFQPHDCGVAEELPSPAETPLHLELERDVTAGPVHRFQQWIGQWDADHCRILFGYGHRNGIRSGGCRSSGELPIAGVDRPEIPARFTP